MTDLLQYLKPKERRGSKPRCHWLTHGSRDDVAARLTTLAYPFARVSPKDRWMPCGFDDPTEAQLDKVGGLFNPDIRAQLKRWWLATASDGARTPTFDLVSTCVIDERPGLVLVEAKAHDEELMKEAPGRKLDNKSTDDRKASHDLIGIAIASACDSLCAATGLAWRISRDSHYQMSNRFAWAWKLASLGIPVVLVYLGFLRSEEMKDRGVPLADHADWERLVRAHSDSICPQEIWGKSWAVNGQPFIPLIRSAEIPFDRTITDLLIHG